MTRRCDPRQRAGLPQVAAWLAVTTASAIAVAETPDFATRVAPLLASKCGGCHGPHEAESGFRIHVREQAIAGGDSGAAGIVAGKPEESELFVRIATSDEEARMPADGDPLTADEQRLLKDWIAAGARWPDDMQTLPMALLPAGGAPPLEGADHWAFRPVVRPRVPATPDSGAAHPVDAFLLEKLTTQNLAFSVEADPRALIRRVSFDLVGLPPSPEEIAAFEAACREAGATDGPYGELVNRLLASPHYGERWARHWLDVVRFAESDGFETNKARANAWPYRDWVIESLNADKPFDLFVREQIAGDVLDADAATGFLVGGAKDRVLSPDPVLTANQRADELHDIVGTTGSAFLGLTVGCARCHDHRFDPVPQTDYYRLKAVLEGVQHGERPLESAADEQRRLHDIAALQREREAAARRLEELRPAGAAAAEDFAALSPNERAEAESLVASIADLDARLKVLKQPVKAYIGVFKQPPPTRRFFRGDPTAPREEVAPGSLTKLGTAWELDADAPEADRRRALAAWIASPTNPLTARVIVNRLWQHHFGTGIVDTPSDFGVNGGRPTHPELLDWLAAELVEGGWRLKAIHKLMVTSRGYRQASAARPEGLAVDSGSRLLWRYPPRRLEAEPLRDAILAVSGSLDRKRGGPGFDLFEPNTNYVKVYVTKTSFTPAEFRRMIYQTKPRAELDNFFGAFDCPDAGQVQPARTVSTTPLQALNMLNGEFLLDQADRFAARVEQEAGPETSRQVARAMLLAFGREASPDEIAAGVALVRDHGLPILCRSLYNASEFITIY
jgi:cytochrome c553